MNSTSTHRPGRAWRLALVLATGAFLAACDKKETATKSPGTDPAVSAPAKVAAPAKPAPPAPKVFRDDTFGFSVASPRTPTRRQESVPTAAGPVTAHFFMFSASSAPGAIMVAVTPSIIPDGVTAEQVLDGAEAGALKNMGGTLVGSDHVELDGNPGRSLRFTVKPQGQAATGHAKIYLRDGALYQVLEVHVDSAKAFGAEATQVVESFAFVPKKS